MKRGSSAPIAAGMVLGLLWGSPATAATLFALVDTGELFVSTNGGTSWSVGSTLLISDAAGLVAGTKPSDLFVASRSGTVFHSADGGTSWNAMGTIASSDVVDVGGRTDGSLLALTRTGVLWVSNDSGVSFTALASLGASDLVSLARGADGTLLALTATGVVRRSTDGGGTWSVVGVLPVPDAVAIRPNGSAYFILTDAGCTYRTLDQGVTWWEVGTVSQVGMRGLVEENGGLVALNRSGLAARSVDGVSWTWVGTVNQLEVVAVANDVPQTVAVPEGPAEAPRLVLVSPRPNPVRAGHVIQIAFRLPQAGGARFDLLDAQGRLQATRDEGPLDIGVSLLSWKLPLLASGVYFLRLSAGRLASATTRLVILD